MKVKMKVLLSMYNYEAADEDEISMNEGDEIIFYEHIDDNWSKGKNRRTGKTGTFPRAYVTTKHASTMHNNPMDRTSVGRS